MKKLYIPFAFLLLVTAFTYGQNKNTVLRVGQEHILGTPRYQAMAGAFGALGGDLSALNANPAGGAVFTKSHIGGTLGTWWHKNEAQFAGELTQENYAAIDFNQAGLALVLEDLDSDWSRFTFAVNYELTSKLDNVDFAGRVNNGLNAYF